MSEQEKGRIYKEQVAELFAQRLAQAVEQKQRGEFTFTVNLGEGGGIRGFSTCFEEYFGRG